MWSSRLGQQIARVIGQRSIRKPEAEIKYSFRNADSTMRQIASRRAAWMRAMTRISTIDMAHLPLGHEKGRRSMPGSPNEIADLHKLGLSRAPS
jgi:hypothetical protein